MPVAASLPRQITAPCCPVPLTRARPAHHQANCLGHIALAFSGRPGPVVFEDAADLVAQRGATLSRNHCVGRASSLSRPRQDDQAHHGQRRPVRTSETNRCLPCQACVLGQTQAIGADRWQVVGKSRGSRRWQSSWAGSHHDESRAKPDTARPDAATKMYHPARFTGSKQWHLDQIPDIRYQIRNISTALH